MYKPQTNSVISLLNDLNHINKAIEFDNSVTKYLNEKKSLGFFDWILLFLAKGYIGLVGYKTYTDGRKLLDSF
jgi:hypothetical protein